MRPPRWLRFDGTSAERIIIACLLPVAGPLLIFAGAIVWMFIALATGKTTTAAIGEGVVVGGLVIVGLTLAIFVLFTPLLYGLTHGASDHVWWVRLGSLLPLAFGAFFVQTDGWEFRSLAVALVVAGFVAHVASYRLASQSEAMPVPPIGKQ